MKYNPYSVSRMGTFSNCPKKFKLKYIDKIKLEESQLALYRGSFAHEILENKFDYSIKPKINEVFTKEEAKKIVDIIKKFRKTEVGKAIENLINLDESVKEEDFAFNSKLELIDFKNSNSWFRGSADLYNVSLQQPIIIDYKTGKDKSKDKEFGNEQGMLYSIYLFIKFPHINKVKASFIFIEHSTHKNIYYYREELPNYLKLFYNKTKNIENTKIFKESVSELCPFCVYNNTEFCTSFIDNQLKTESILESKMSLDF